MRVEMEKWVMEIDVSMTRTYSDQELAENCRCDYCRNYYACVDKHYPQLGRFLLQFGVQIHAPEEMDTYETEHGIYYLPQYSVAGSIVRYGDVPIAVGSLNVTPTEDLIAQERMGTEAFSLCVDGFILPRVVKDEDHFS